jgi:phage tail sheath gpL-like
MPSIDLIGLAAEDPSPGVFAQVNFAQGPPAGFGGSYDIILIGNRTTAGSATVDTAVYGPDTSTPLSTEADAVSLFGAGSELHRMWRRVVPINPSTSVYAIAVAESGGTAASRAYTFATAASASGTVRFWICGEKVEYSFISGDSVTTTAAGVKAAINARSHLPLTADNSSGVLTLTAKLKGPRGNRIRIRSEITGGAGTTLDVTGSNYLASGATADSNTNALATIAPLNFYYQVSAANDSTQYGALLTQITSQALPLNGSLQRAVAGFNDSAANAITLATAINNPRAELVTLTHSDMTPEELAAVATAVYSLFESTAVPRLNFNFFGSTAYSSGLWPVKAPLDGSAPTKAQIKSMLMSGVTPIGVGKGGSTYITRRVTTYSLNGSNQDSRVRDAGKVTVCDKYTNDLKTRVGAAIEGKNIGDDPIGNEPIPSNVITPRDIKAIANKLTGDYASNGLLEREGEIKANTICIRNANPTDSIGVIIPLNISDIMNRAALRVDQVG